LPLSPAGKVDRKALAGRTVPQFEIARPGSKPQNRWEQGLAEIWEDVLGVPVIDSGRTFFEYGGSSLKILRIQNRIRTKMGVNITVADLFKYPTIKGLALALVQDADGIRVKGGAIGGSDGELKNESIEVMRMTVDDIQQLVASEYAASIDVR
jgi:hypothetical protein